MPLNTEFRLVSVVQNWIYDIILARDVFGKWEIKPWWEKLRAYMQRVLLALVAYLLWDVGIPEIPIECEPLYTTDKLNSAIGRALCEANPPFVLAFFPYLSLFLIALVFAIDVAWAKIPKVHQTFEALLQCDGIVRELNMTPRQVAAAVRNIVLEQEQFDSNLTVDVVMKLRGVCYDLWTNHPSCFPLSIQLIYDLRNRLTLMLNILSSWVYYLAILRPPCHSEYNGGNVFTCEISRSKTKFDPSFPEVLVLIKLIELAFQLLLFGMVIMKSCRTTCMSIVIHGVGLGLFVLSYYFMVHFCATMDTKESTDMHCLASRIFLSVSIMSQSFLFHISTVIDETPPYLRKYSGMLSVVVHGMICLLLVYELDKFRLREWNVIPIYSIISVVAVWWFTYKLLNRFREPHIRQHLQPYPAWLRPLQQKIIEREDDNRFAFNYIRQSDSRRIGPETEVVLFPTELFHRDLRGAARFLHGYAHLNND